MSSCGKPNESVTPKKRSTVMGNTRTEKLARVNHWEELFRLRDEQRERVRTAVTLVKGKKLPL